MTGNEGAKAIAGHGESGVGRRGNRWRIAGWSAAALLLLLPLVAMQFTEGVVWDVADFAVAGALLVGAGVTLELAARRTGNGAYRAAVGVALGAAVILVWVNGAVGVIGTESNDANLMYGGVLAVGVIGALIALPTPWDGTRVVGDGACSGVGRPDRADRRIGLHGADLAAGYLDVDGLLRRAVVRVGLAVSESGAREGRTGCGITSRRTRTKRSTVSLPAKRKLPRRR